MISSYLHEHGVHGVVVVLRVLALNRLRVKVGLEPRQDVQRHLRQNVVRRFGVRTARIAPRVARLHKNKPRQSDTESAGMFSRRTNQMQEAGYILMMDQS